MELFVDRWQVLKMGQSGRECEDCGLTTCFADQHHMTARTIGGTGPGRNVVPKRVEVETQFAQFDGIWELLDICEDVFAHRPPDHGPFE